MSNAWEITTDDVLTVLRKHGKNVSETKAESILENLDKEIIIDNLLFYNSMDDQSNSMLSDIEDALMNSNVIHKANKLFVM